MRPGAKRKDAGKKYTKESGVFSTFAVIFFKSSQGRLHKGLEQIFKMFMVRLVLM